MDCAAGNKSIRTEKSQLNVSHTEPALKYPRGTIELLRDRSLAVDYPRVELPMMLRISLTRSSSRSCPTNPHSKPCTVARGG